VRRVGMAMLEAEERRKRTFRDIHRLNQHESEARVQVAVPLSMENVVLLRDRQQRYQPLLAISPSRLPRH